MEEHAVRKLMDAMTRKARNAPEAFLAYTQDLYVAKRLYGYSLTWQHGAGEDPALIGWLDDHYASKKWRRAERQCSYTEWMINGVFPQILYEQNHSNLQQLLTDERLVAPAAYARLDAWNSFFGRMARPRDGLTEGFVHYLLRRLKVPNQRSQPTFYFDVEQPSWVFQELVNYPNRPRSWRTSAACVMNIVFKYDSRSDCLWCWLMLRSNQWSHVYGDIFGAESILRVVLREVGMEQGRCMLCIPSATMDDPAGARALLRQFGGLKR